jgi:hypothetical protein
LWSLFQILKFLWVIALISGWLMVFRTVIWMLPWGGWGSK